MRRRFLLLALVPLLLAADWPRFRGPNGTGVAADQSIPVAIGKGDVIWKIDVPGNGVSSPIVSKGKLFLQTATPDQERMLICYDAATGKRLWHAAFTGVAVKTHTKNSLASSTPAADGERVYAVFWDGKELLLTAYDYDGRALWQAPLGGFKSQHGAGLSPMVVDGKVVVHLDQDGKAELLAFDAATGKKAWAVPRPAFRACYSTPFVMETPAGNELIVSSTASISAYRPATGEEVWRWDWVHYSKPLRTVGSPIAHQGIVFACAGDGDGSRHMVAVKAGGKGDGGASALLWEKKPKGTAYVPCPLALGDHVFWVNDVGNAACVVAKTGKEVWTEERLMRSGVTASPVLIDGKIYVVDERGGLVVFAASPKFEVLGRGDFGEEVYASPAVADGRLYVRGKEHLFCIGKR